LAGRHPLKAFFATTSIKTDFLNKSFLNKNLDKRLIICFLNFTGAINFIAINLLNFILSSLTFF